ncbi:MAG: hypothetical protein F6K40_38140 [Okeania sp. SIO3I5]|uniref:hypothetical protein n=1 Tax=Okeania sp. SIO3I5 TaxID=2607805 RepID=UPI0013B81DAA|nr:hypothetical protein [Okeania sp. SIO3I5]NEQ41698.1 hypothetical protein [Okeania sp. SIO3I5]
MRKSWIYKNSQKIFRENLEQALRNWQEKLADYENKLSINTSAENNENNHINIKLCNYFYSNLY